MSVAAGIETTEDVATGLATIEGIDLEAEIPCEVENGGHNRPEHPADYIIRSRCGGCQNTSLFGMCRALWSKWDLDGPCYCVRCGWRGTWRDALSVVKELRR